MHVVTNALQAYMARELGWDALVEQLHSALLSGHVAREELLMELDTACSEGLIPQQVEETLRTFFGSLDLPSSPPSADETRIGRQTIAPPARHRASPDPDQFTVRPDPPTSSPERFGPSDVKPPDSEVRSDWSRLAYEDDASVKEVGVGTVLNGKFVLEEVLGQGGMGTVFRAKDNRRVETHDKKPYVAVKVLGEEFKRHPQALVALQREASKAQSLAHPNIVTVHDYDRDGHIVYMWMELLEGEPLDRIVAKSVSRGGLPLNEVLPLIRGMANALIYAHAQGVVHSDLKPSNVFVTREGTVKVLDFGIARAIWTPDQMDKSTLFDAGELGAMTPAYASPEMLLELEPHPRDDVYALACVTYELLAGRHPFERMPAHLAMHAGLRLKPIPGLKRRQMKAIAGGLAFTRGRRIGDVRDFLRAFEQKAPMGPIPKAGLAATGLMAIAALGGGGYYVSQSCARIDSAFLSSLGASGAELPADANDRLVRDYEAFLSLGRNWLGMAQEEFNSEVLYESQVSSAYGAFIEALELNRHSTEAATGILTIVEMYAAEARRLLAAGRPADAVRLATIGLEIHPNHCALNETLRDAERN